MCGRRFNELDDGWICSLAREGIYEQIGHVVELAGFSSYDQDWISKQEW